MYFALMPRSSHILITFDVGKDTRPDLLAFQRFRLYEGGERLGAGRQKNALSKLTGRARRFEFIFCVIELVIVRSGISARS